MSIITTENKEHQYTQRSCTNCKLLAECQQKWKRDERMQWCDCAKYGCVNYTGEFQTEMTKAKIKAVQKAAEAAKKKDNNNQKQ